MRSTRRRPTAQAAALSCLPMLTSLAGAWVDEHTHLGFSLWRAACRASDLSLSSLLVFTRELLPTAILGALLGASLLLIAGLRATSVCGAGTALAAHAGCLLGMPLGLLLCAAALPLPAALAAELLLTGAIAALLARRLDRSSYRLAGIPT